MPRIFRAGPLLLALHCYFASAETSYHFLGPVSGMYLLPVGESPGWSADTWFNLETSVGNVWNYGSHFLDKRNGNDYYLFADYEQDVAVAEFGQAIGKYIGVAVEVPYVNHNGGFMDDFVDQFHILIQSDRFKRNTSPKYGNHFVVQKNGIDQLSSEHDEGTGNMKAKLKYWAWQNSSPTPGACDCGLAFSAQVKFPMQNRQHGLTSGSNDYSGLIHFGLPFGSNSGVMATAAFTKLGRNETFAEWPTRTWEQMYELHLNLGLGPRWSVILEARADSPLMNKEYLDFQYSYSDKDLNNQERVASAWNSLVEWRGSEDIRFRYNWGKANSFDIGFVEDWAIGPQDNSNDGLYLNNAPDFQAMTTLHFSF